MPHQRLTSRPNLLSGIRIGSATTPRCDRAERFRCPTYTSVWVCITHGKPRCDRRLRLCLTSQQEGDPQNERPGNQHKHRSGFPRRRAGRARFLTLTSQILIKKCSVLPEGLAGRSRIRIASTARSLCTMQTGGARAPRP